jgi:hypothetical protein
MRTFRIDGARALFSVSVAMAGTTRESHELGRLISVPNERTAISIDARRGIEPNGGCCDPLPHREALVALVFVLEPLNFGHRATGGGFVLWPLHHTIGFLAATAIEAGAAVAHPIATAFLILLTSLDPPRHLPRRGFSFLRYFRNV